MQGNYRLRSVAFLLLVALLTGLVLAPAPVAAAPAGATAQSGETHIVRPGETLSGIAGAYGVTVYALMKANMISDPNHIYAGQRLVIPSGGMEGGMGGDMGSGMSGGWMGDDMAKVECRDYHTVQPGETGAEIARDYGVSTYSLVEANMLVDINTVYGGQQLCIPNTPRPVQGPSQPMPMDDRHEAMPMPEPMPMPEYRPMPEPMPMPEKHGDCMVIMVRKGDTLSDIAQQNGASVYELMRLNNIHDPNTIYAGQMLKIECDGQRGDWMPEPKPMPMPEHRTMPEPMPMPMPEQRPMPMPMPEQRPMPMPMPEQRPMPEHRTMPMPEQRPMPEPMPMPMPMPEQRPMPDKHMGWTEVEQGPWWGSYYCDKYFGGEPVIMREDYDIRFNWYGGSPGHMVPEDRFSAKWERIAMLEGGWYRWVVTVDDGVRIYVDEQLVLDAWREQPATEYTADFYAHPGKHKFRVEYYEEANEATISVRLERR